MEIRVMNRKVRIGRYGSGCTNIPRSAASVKDYFTWAEETVPTPRAVLITVSDNVRRATGLSSKRCELNIQRFDS